MPTATEQPLLRFRDLHKSFGGQTVLGGINGEIRPCEVILLRGENGSGKTTLLNILSGCLEPDRGSIEIAKPDGVDRESFTFPHPWYRGINPFEHFTPERVARLGISRTWQDIRLIASLDLADNIAVAAPSSCDSPWAALFQWRRTLQTHDTHRATAHNRLAALGLIERDDSSGAKISLGQSKRVALARAIQADARVILLDEPLSGLDASGVREIVGQLRELAVQHRLTLVIVEHVLNIPCLLDFVTSVWTLQDGTLSMGTPLAVQEDITQRGLGESIHDLIKKTIEPKTNAIRAQLPGGASLTTYLVSGGHDAGFEETPIVETRNLRVKRGFRNLFAIPADKEAKQTGVSFTLHDKTINVLEAPNGWGKTSFLDCMIGNLQRTGGDIMFLGCIQQRDFTPNQFFDDGGRALSSTSKMFPSLTVGEVSKLTGCRVEAFDSNRRVGGLSGGELRQLSLLAQSPGKFVIVDEFAHSLDGSKMRSLFAQLLKSSSTACLLFLEPSHTN